MKKQFYSISLRVASMVCLFVAGLFGFNSSAQWTNWPTYNWDEPYESLPGDIKIFNDEGEFSFNANYDSNVGDEGPDGDMMYVETPSPFFTNDNVDGRIYVKKSDISFGYSDDEKAWFIAINAWDIVDEYYGIGGEWYLWVPRQYFMQGKDPWPAFGAYQDFCFVVASGEASLEIPEATSTPAYGSNATVPTIDKINLSWDNMWVTFNQNGWQLAIDETPEGEIIYKEFPEVNSWEQLSGMVKIYVSDNANIIKDEEVEDMKKWNPNVQATPSIGVTVQPAGGEYQWDANRRGAIDIIPSEPLTDNTKWYTLSIPTAALDFMDRDSEATGINQGPIDLVYRVSGSKEAIITPGNYFQYYYQGKDGQKSQFDGVRIKGEGLKVVDASGIKLYDGYVNDLIDLLNVQEAKAAKAEGRDAVIYNLNNLPAIANATVEKDGSDGEVYLTFGNVDLYDHGYSVYIPTNAITGFDANIIKNKDVNQLASELRFVVNENPVPANHPNVKVYAEPGYNAVVEQLDSVRFHWNNEVFSIVSDKIKLDPVKTLKGKLNGPDGEQEVYFDIVKEQQLDDSDDGQGGGVANQYNYYLAYIPETPIVKGGDYTLTVPAGIMNLQLSWNNLPANQELVYNFTVTPKASYMGEATQLDPDAREYYSYGQNILVTWNRQPIQFVEGLALTNDSKRTTVEGVLHIEGIQGGNPVDYTYPVQADLSYTLETGPDDGATDGEYGEETRSLDGLKLTLRVPRDDEFKWFFGAPTGTYTYTIPAGLVVNEDGELNPEQSFVLKVINQVGIDPAPTFDPETADGWYEDDMEWPPTPQFRLPETAAEVNGLTTVTIDWGKDIVKIQENPYITVSTPENGNFDVTDFSIVDNKLVMNVAEFVNEEGQYSINVGENIVVLDDNGTYLLNREHILLYKLQRDVNIATGDVKFVPNEGHNSTEIKESDELKEQGLDGHITVQTQANGQSATLEINVPAEGYEIYYRLSELPDTYGVRRASLEDEGWTKAENNRILLPSGNGYVEIKASNGTAETNTLKYTYSVMGPTAIGAVEADGNGEWRVYNTAGVNVLNTSNASELRNLAPGLYIVNGKKLLVK